ncbi:MAG: extracellular solute-binding protein [Bacillota bacterium]
MSKKIMAVALIVILLVGALAGCTSGNKEASQPTEQEQGKKFKTDEITLYIRMMEEQDKWFRENIISSFEKEYGVKVNVRTFESEMDLENVMKLDQDKKTIGLVKTMHTQLTPLAEKGLVMDLEQAVGEKYKEDVKEYSDAAMKMGTINGKVYYIPRKLETNTLLYLKSKVEDAVANWSKFEKPINDMFKAENGAGLPVGYKLEADPNEWDWYDLAVVGYYWSNTEYDGKKEPRIAHRGKKYDGTVVELVTKIYQAGGTPEDALAMNTDPVKDTFKWEVFFKENNLYNPGMWEEEWSGGGIWKAMAAGKVYMAFMHQMDGFFIHGGSTPSMTGYLTDPDDMAVAVMPKGVSLELKDGKPVREGVKGSQLAGWWWGIPTSTPDPELSYELARWITNAENHKKESQTFGMMPIRKDIVDNLSDAFKEPWMQEVFNVAQRQIDENVQALPRVQAWPEVGQVYLDAWYDIVVGGNNKDISKVLDETYAPKAAELLK